MGRFGREHVHDPRDRRFRIKRGRRPLVGKKYWRESPTRLYQPDVPQCVGYAWARWLLWPPIGQYIEPEGIYLCAQRFDEWEGDDYDGTSVRAGAKVLESLGFIERYEWAADIETLVETVRYVGPIVVGTNWYQGMDRLDASGLIRPTGRTLGGHAYNVTGVDCTGERLRIASPWKDSNFGVDGQGNAEILFADFARLLAEDGEACLAIERKAQARAA